MKNKQFCSEPDCYKYVDEYDIVYRNDGSIHPISLKCYSCRTDKENKQLKNFVKQRRHKNNKKLKSLINNK